MSRSGRRAAVAAGTAVAFVLTEVGSASADGPLRPVDPDTPGDGIPGVFIFLFVVFLIAGVAVTIWRVSTARTLARQSGMDPGQATQMALLSDDGLDATYLAASLRQRPSRPVAPTSGSPSGSVPTTDGHSPVGSPSDRLTELKHLLDQGLVTQSEYDERRRAIIDGV